MIIITNESDTPMQLLQHTVKIENDGCQTIGDVIQGWQLDPNTSTTVEEWRDDLVYSLRTRPVPA